MLSTSIDFERTKNMKELALKLQDKDYDVISGHNLLILRPRLKKYFTGGTLFFGGQKFLSAKKIILNYKDENIFIDVKLSISVYIIGCMLFIFLMEGAREVDYAFHMRLSMFFSLAYCFSVWITVVSIRNEVKRDIKASMAEKKSDFLDGFSC